MVEYVLHGPQDVRVAVGQRRAGVAQRVFRHPRQVHACLDKRPRSLFAKVMSRGKSAGDCVVQLDCNDASFGMWGRRVLCFPGAVFAESMLTDPRVPKSRADRILKDTEGGKSLVGQERCRLRIHNRPNLARPASRGASHGRHAHITIGAQPVWGLTDAAAYTGRQPPWL